MQTTFESMKLRYLGGEVGRDGGCHYRWFGLVVGRVETRFYDIVSLPEPRERRTLSVAVVEAKEGSWAQNWEGGELKRYDK